MECRRAFRGAPTVGRAVEEKGFLVEWSSNWSGGGFLVVGRAAVALGVGERKSSIGGK